MQPRSTFNPDYPDDLVGIINYLADAINQETSSYTTSSLLNMLAFSVNEYEKNRMEDIQLLTTARAMQVIHANHLYQRHYEKHLHRNVYADEAAELSRALHVYEESIYDDIQAINLMVAQLRASMMVQFLEAQTRQVQEMAALSARERFLEERASELQQQADANETHNDFDSSYEDVELYPLFDDFDPKDPNIEWETSPLLLLEDFQSEEDSNRNDSFYNTPASPRFFATPVATPKRQLSDTEYTDSEENNIVSEDEKYFSHSTDSDDDIIDSDKLHRASYRRI